MISGVADNNFNWIPNEVHHMWMYDHINSFTQLYRPANASLDAEHYLTQL